MEYFLKGELAGKTQAELHELLTKEFDPKSRRWRIDPEAIAAMEEWGRKNIEPYEVLAGTLDVGSYEGWAYLLLRHRETGEFYEVVGSHCSCMGFEDQWRPEPASLAYLLSPMWHTYNMDINTLRQWIVENLEISYADMQKAAEQGHKKLTEWRAARTANNAERLDKMVQQVEAWLVKLDGMMEKAAR